MAVPRKVLGLGAAVAVLLAVFLLWQWLRHDGDQLVLYGNVDIRQVDLSFRVNGRIASVLVDEGDAVAPGQALAFGGETTVRLVGDGMGGRNQELALRLAMLAETQPVGFDWAFASVGSDGRDGPGEAAGGLVGPGTVAAIRAGGIDPAEALSRNDSTPALAAGKALVMTGATGTNVADLAVLVRA